MRLKITFSAFVAIWLLIGVIATVQRGYLFASEQSCATLGSTLTTVFVGPLNYMGVNPEIDCPTLPEPSE
ncbi:hypothetical protein [Allosalinactinospora lopnorensis]|uniref:hypothetical protein n=1 Tax=Allosalinactinospora lopnorensis TaxID=1352348 RepID=UPI000623ED6E|nr:hypothetical protein [Allosalinactinospora lopnorensis]